MRERPESILILADGRTFRGYAFGAARTTVGEIVFNTAMTGYQEILTDPSYCGQLVCMTQPHIGVYGSNDVDCESRDRRIWASGLIVRELSEIHSSRRASATLSEYLESHGIGGITGIDTRALTRHIRDAGAMVGAIAPADVPIESVREEIRDWGSMEGKALVGAVSCDSPYTVSAIGAERFRVAAYDFGAKQNIFREMAKRGITITVFPDHAPAATLAAADPDGFFLSNGPGDPAACVDAVVNVRALLGAKPMMGICLGHQLMGLAIGAQTYKLPFGHHGANHPVKDITTGRIEITSQNHGFAVSERSLTAAGGEVTHVNLNDGSIEGFEIPDRRAFCVQYHPEACPGPHDARYLFDRFVQLLERG
jgi:carbamoyl-phosphate synthase small subunit